MELLARPKQNAPAEVSPAEIKKMKIIGAGILFFGVLMVVLAVVLPWVCFWSSFFLTPGGYCTLVSRPGLFYFGARFFYYDLYLFT